MQYCSTDFLVLAILVLKNHKNVRLGKKYVPFREKIRFTIHVMTNFMKEHIPWVTQEDTTDFMSKTDGTAKAKLQFWDIPASSSAGG